MNYEDYKAQRKSLCSLWLILLVFFVTLSPGSAGAQSFGKNKVRYNNLVWNILKSEHFELYFNPEIEPLAKTALNMAESAYRRIKEDFSWEVSKPIPLILFKSHYDFQQTNVILELIDRGVGGFAEVFKYRIVIPFTGSYQRLEYVITHELTHIFTFDILYQDIFKSILTSKNVISPPLWLMEGVAEFETGELDSTGEMVLRDALLNNSLYPLADLGNFYGLSNVYLAYKESHSLLNHIGQKYGRKKVGLIIKRFKDDPDMEKVIKTTLEVDLAALEKEWKNELRRRYYPKIAKEKFGEDYGKEIIKGVRSAALSPGEDILAVLTSRAGKDCIDLIRIEDGKRISTITKGMNFAKFEEINSEGRTLDWSPAGREIVFAAKNNGRDRIFIYDCILSKLKEIIDISELDGISSPSLSPSGKELAFSGLKNGQSHIYRLSLTSKKLSKLTYSSYLDSQPVWSRNGKQILFLREEKDGLDIYLFNLETDKERLVLANKAKNIHPAFKDDTTIIFSSNLDGTYNLYTYNLESKEISKLTSAVGGLFHPLFLKEEKLIFASYAEGGYSLYQSQISSLEQETAQIKEQEESEETESPGAQAAFSDTSTSTGKYETKFSLDYIQGSFSYNSSYGLGTSTQLAFSDVLGDHRFVLVTDYLSITNDLSDFNFIFSYHYLEKRPDFSVGIFNLKDYYKGLDKEAIDWSYGGFFFVNYPLSKFKRLELGLISLYETEGDIKPDKNLTKESQDLLSLSYVTDTAIWGYGTLLSGARSRFTVERTLGLFNDTDYTNFKADLRKYLRLGKDSTLALRMTGKVSLGPNAREFKLGGDGVGTSEILRGFRSGEFKGKRLFATNIEFRFPFIKRADLGFPFFFSIRGLRGVIFTDLGVAFNEEDKPELWIDEDGKTRLKDLKLSYGLGLRTVLGFFPLRFDWAWANDLGGVYDTYFHLTLGYDF